MRHLVCHLAFFVTIVAFVLARPPPPVLPNNLYLEAATTCVVNNTDTCPPGFEGVITLSKIWYEFDTNTNLLQFAREDDLVIGPYGPPQGGPGIIYDQSYLTSTNVNSTSYELDYWYLVAGQTTMQCVTKLLDSYPLTTDYLSQATFEGVDVLAGIACYKYRNNYEVDGQELSLITYVTVETDEILGFFNVDEGIQILVTYAEALNEISLDIRTMPIAQNCQSGSGPSVQRPPKLLSLLATRV